MGDNMKRFLKEIQIQQEILDHYNTADEVVLDVFNRLKSLHKTYMAHDISHNIFKHSINDLEKRLLNNLKIYQILTLKEKEMKWVNMVLDFKIFKLGSLRFQYFPMDYQEIERDSFDAMPLDEKTKSVFYEGRPLINVHIETGTDLSEASVSDAFKQAHLFFSRVFKDVTFDGFVCRTWLLYPDTLTLLSPSSNIYKFAKRFEIIAQNQATYQALERVYGTKDLKKIKKLPKENSLEKTIYKNLDKLGVAFGFIPF